ncbi:hypothetical protein ACIPLC_19480 [Kitasatospora sp. NPDC086801]|uniref:hypothetical protein n=1 Tax=Kitasatospora sp. NPDC086801 TaxID=3364066 RepID=UPI003828A810
MPVRKGLTAALLLITPALGLVAAPVAEAAETTTVVTGPVSLPGGWSTATCPGGTHLTGGGYTFRPATSGDAVLVNAPNPDDPGTWVVRARYGTVRAYAACETEA